MKRLTVAAWTVAALAVAGTSGVALAENEGEHEAKPSYHASIQVPAKLENGTALQKLAKITREDAARIAQGSAPGTVVETKLENEDQNLVYTVEVSSGGKTSEVIVDAGNGKVLAVNADTDSENDEEQDGD
jgi:uncharacterized membrane protein YkoI